MAATSRVPLQNYVTKAQASFQFSDPLGSAYKGAFLKSIAEPMLDKSHKNRIIYFIGSFNPPHQGHLAIIEHIAATVLVSAGSVQRTPDDSLNALTLIIIPHAEDWIHRKLRKEKKAASPAASAPSLHLNFKQRSSLVRQSLTEELVRRNVWLFPDDLGEWWTFQNHLVQACQKDGYELEFVELLGPDYVSWQRPRCSGQHGVVTSNICRVPDFEPRDHKMDLVNLDGFSAWMAVEEDAVSNEPAVSNATSYGIFPQNGRRDVLWVCAHKRNPEYRIWFVQRDTPAMDSNISSTQLRKIITDTDINRLEEAVQAHALSPKQLVQYVRKQQRR